MLQARQGIFVWFEHMRNLRQIKRFGHLVYVSKKLKYASLYVNKEDLDVIEERLQKYSFIRRIERSQKPFIETTFKKDEYPEEKPFQYKMGI